MFHPPAPVIVLRFADGACVLAKAFYLLWKAFAFWRRRTIFCGGITFFVKAFCVFAKASPS